MILEVSCLRFHEDKLTEVSVGKDVVRIAIYVPCRALEMATRKKHPQ